MFNENHVMEALSLNKVNAEDVKTLVQPNIQAYLKQYYGIHNEEQVET